MVGGLVPGELVGSWWAPPPQGQRGIGVGRTGEFLTCDFPVCTALGEGLPGLAKRDGRSVLVVVVV